MTDFENGAIKHQISFERYKNGRADEIIALLDKADAEIAAYIRKTDSVYTKARYKEIAKKLREVSKALKEKVDENTDVDAVIDYELKKQKKLFGLINDTKGGEIQFLFPSKEQIKTAALFKPAADNLTYESYLNGIEAGLYNTWDSAVRTGYLTGMPTKEIVREVMGGVSPEAKLRNPGRINSLRNSIYGNTRTLLQSFAEETKEKVYKENEKYFGDGETDYKYEYLATLDNRTCLVCADCSGKLYKSLAEAPNLPQHRNCVLGDTLVSTVGKISKVYRRRYKGLIYRITTASGNVLSVTPNHPILTDKGFVRAHLLNIGDNVISNNGLETLGIIGENEKHREAFIQDVFSTFSKSPFMFSATVPTTAEDFHSDSVYNKVDIISTNRELEGISNIQYSKSVFENSFINRFSTRSKKESCESRFFKLSSCTFTAFSSLMRRFCKMCDLFWGRILHSLNLLFSWIPLRNIVSLKEGNHSHSAETKSFSDTSNTDSMIVKFKNFINRKIVSRAFSRCFNVGVMQNDSDDVFGTTVLFSNILDRYSTQIKVDNIVAIDVKFSFTHVYNLETENNWYVANGIITHNCRCLILPYFNIEGDTRASKDGYVDADITFDDWLKDQDEKTQKDVLGATRYKMFKDGVKISQFVDNGKVLTLDELNETLE